MKTRMPTPGRRWRSLLMTALMTAPLWAGACGGDEQPAAKDATTDEAGDAVADAESVDAGQVADTAGPADTSGGCTCEGFDCGYPAGCSVSCGACPAGKKCSNNICKDKPPSEQLIKMGQWCGPYEGCLPPASGSSQIDYDNYYDCLDDQCETKDCSGNVCTRNCTITKDKVINHSGESGADGIEDPGVESECAAAVDGPHGDTYRCIELRSEAQVAQGQNYQICRAGTTFAPCKASADCPDGEVCQLIYLMGEYQNRCRPKHKQPDGKPGKVFSEACNSNPYAGDVALCQSGTCFGWGCMAFCDSDQDCVTTPGACKAGKCPNGAVCKDDTDCSAWGCEAGHTIYSNVDKTFKMCWPKGCKVDGDCGDDEFYCRLAYNGVVSQTGDPDPDDPNKVILPDWDNYCRRRLPGSAAKGEACDPYSTDDIKAHPPCQNPFACDNGVCGGYCGADADCPASMRCGVSDLRFDTDDPDDGLYDVFLAYGSCVHMPEAGTVCHAQADCPGGHCKGWRHANPAAASDDKAPAWSSSGQCTQPSDSKGVYGDTCGPLGKGAICNSGWCANTSSSSGKAQVGFCTDLCGGRLECKGALKLYNKTYKSVCRSYKQTYNATLPPHDDVYLPYCWVSNSSASLDDRSSDKVCGSAKEACRAFPIAFGPDKAMKVEFWCSWNQNSSAPQPTKKAGEVCELDANGYQCLGGYCMTDVAAGKGYCSRICAEDSDCGQAIDGMFCDMENMGFPGLPRSDPKMAAIVPICRKKKSCIPCSWDYQCAGDNRCTNLGGPGTLSNQRCAPPCETDANCAGSDGGAKCQPATDRDGKPTANKVCTPKCS